MLVRRTLLVPLLLAATGRAQVDVASLVHELVDLPRLARLPAEPYRTLELSSHDRRSTGPEAPGWFANWDGYSPDPAWGFEKVLRPPGDDGVGLFLLCDLDGPGAIQRTWSALMQGTLRVYVDDATEPLFEGRGDDFLCRRSALWFREAGIEVPPAPLFEQENADYLPVPFGHHLRITWEGDPFAVRYYQVVVRRYPKDTAVTGLSLQRLAAAAPALRAAWQRAVALREQQPVFDRTLELAPGATTRVAVSREGPAAIERLALRLHARDEVAALRGTLLRLRFDDASRPQVEAPAGDFFGSGPGLNPLRSIPMSVAPDGAMTCRFVMPYQRHASVELTNTTEQPVHVDLDVRTGDWRWDDRSAYFRAKWRVDSQLAAPGPDAPYDVPWLFVLGRGRLVGASCSVWNPPRDTRIGCWWGEGDEKVFVDGESTPRLFGTGSEDYFNYAWGSHDLFDDALCGQSLATGAFSTGHVANHRFQLADDVPFDHSLAFVMELATERADATMALGRIVYHYARPNAVDDHRALQPLELRVTGDEPGAGLALGGRAALATAAALHGDGVEVSPDGGSVTWSAKPGDRVTWPVPVAQDGAVAVELLAGMRPDGGTVAAHLDGVRLRLQDGGDDAVCLAGERCWRRLRFAAVEHGEGAAELTLQCTGAGAVELRQVVTQVVKWAPRAIPGAVEAEALTVVDRSDGVALERQKMPAQAWSGGAHLLVRAPAVGAFVELSVPVPAGGRYRLLLHPTGSRDFGVLGFALDGRDCGVRLDTYRPRRDGIAPMPPVELGEVAGGAPVRLRIEVVGKDPDAEAPGTYFGLDAVQLAPVAGG